MYELEPVEQEFTYPMWFKYKDCEMIVRFDSLNTFTVIDKGTSSRENGEVVTVQHNHTKHYWTQIDKPKKVKDKRFFNCKIKVSKKLVKLLMSN